MRAGALPLTTPAVDADQEVVGQHDRRERLARLALVQPGVMSGSVLAHERTLPVLAGVQELLPSGVLQRGSTLAAHGPGATSFALALVAEAAREGSFLAIVAPRTFGLGACLDVGIPLRRVVQFVLPPEAAGRAGWAQLVAAVIEGFDLVVLADRHRATASQARQLTARGRERGSVIIRAGGSSWPDAPDLRFDLQAPTWHGLGQGHGHVQSRDVSVQVAGRRWPGAPRVRTLRLSGDGVELIERRSVVADRSVATARHAGADIDALVDADVHQRESTDGQAGRRFGTVA